LSALAGAGAFGAAARRRRLRQQVKQMMPRERGRDRRLLFITIKLHAQEVKRVVSSSSDPAAVSSGRPS
jgi:hypothetical protein